MAKVPAVDPLLAQLRDVHLPEPIGLWPLAPGWYLLLALSICAMLMVFRRYKRSQVKRAALALLAEYKREYQRDANPQEIVVKTSDLLRRVALVYFPRAEVAGMQGQAWIDFLDKTGKGIDFNEIRDLLLILPYEKRQTTSRAENPSSRAQRGISCSPGDVSCVDKTSLEPLFAATKAWIKQRGGHV